MTSPPPVAIARGAVISLREKNKEDSSRTSAEKRKGAKKDTREQGNENSGKKKKPAPLPPLLN